VSQSASHVGMRKYTACWCHCHRLVRRPSVGQRIVRCSVTYSVLIPSHIGSRDYIVTHPLPACTATHSRVDPDPHTFIRVDPDPGWAASVLHPRGHTRIHRHVLVTSASLGNTATLPCNTVTYCAWVYIVTYCVWVKMTRTSSHVACPCHLDPRRHILRHSM
jgi:hypothetical protein